MVFGKTIICMHNLKTIIERVRPHGDFLKVAFGYGFTNKKHITTSFYKLNGNVFFIVYFPGNKTELVVLYSCFRITIFNDI